MKAVLYERFGETPEMRVIADPEPSGGSVLIKVEACGICRSDWHGWMGNDPDITLPHVPGHELAGTVVETGPGIRNWKADDRVTVPFVCGCGSCPQCESGNQQVCDSQFQPGFTHWGAFAEFVEIRYADENLVALPENIDPVTAAALGCRFMTSFRGIAHQAKVRPGEWVTIFGCGGVGLSAMMIAKAFGARVVAIDIGADKLNLATELGAEAVVLSLPESDVPAIVTEITNGGASVSVDAIGHPSAVRDSILGLAKRGRHIQIGLLEQGANCPSVPMNQIVAKEIEIYGSHGMQAHRYPEMFDLIDKKRLDPGKLVGRTVTLEGSIAVLTAMDEFPEAGTTVIDTF